MIQAFKNLGANIVLVIKALCIKGFVCKVTFTGSPSEIVMKLKGWRAARNVWLIESFYERNTYKKAHCWETFYYVEANMLMRWCGMGDHRYKRNMTNNGVRAINQREKD